MSRDRGNLERKKRKKRVPFLINSLRLESAASGICSAVINRSGMTLFTGHSELRLAVGRVQHLRGREREDNAQRQGRGL